MFFNEAGMDFGQGKIRFLRSKDLMFSNLLPELKTGHLNIERSHVTLFIWVEVHINLSVSNCISNTYL